RWWRRSGGKLSHDSALEAPDLRDERGQLLRKNAQGTDEDHHDDGVAYDRSALFYLPAGPGNASDHRANPDRGALDPRDLPRGDEHRQGERHAEQHEGKLDRVGVDGADTVAVNEQGEDG